MAPTTPTTARTSTLRLVSRLLAEEGQALVVALIVMFALTISTAGVITYMTSNETSFGRDRDANRALDIAEAGLQEGVATLTAYDPTLTRLRAPDATGYLPSTPYSLDGGSGTYSAVKTTAHLSGDATDNWTVTATGTYGHVTRTVQEQTTATATTAPPSPVYGYGLYVAGGGGGCTVLSGSITINANVWIGNDFCPNGATAITAPADNTYTFYVGGNYKGGNNQSVGTSSVKMKEASIVGGCYNGTNQVVCSVNTGQNKNRSGIWAYGYDSTKQTLPMPSVDSSTIYGDGDWASPTCTSTSGYIPYVFQPGASPSTNPTNTVTLDTGKYDCLVTGGTRADSYCLTHTCRMAFDPSTNTLTVEGEIFIDGNLQLNSNIKYSAGTDGTIYVNGTVLSKGTLCGPPTTVNNNNCSGTWDTTQGSLEIVAMNAGSCPPNTTPSCDPTSIGWEVSGSGEIDAIVFVIGTIDSSGNGSSGNFHGPIIATGAILSGGGGLSYPGPPPDAAPGGSTQISTWGVVPSSWRQLPN